MSYSDVPKEANEAQIEAAGAIRRLAHALANVHAPTDLSRRITKALEPFAPELARLGTVIDRSKEFLFERQPTPIGQSIEFDPYSIVVGKRNPFGIGGRHERTEEGSTTTVVCQKAFEGPPGRVHGGVVALLFDEATAAFVVSIGEPAFTASVATKLIKAAPLNVELKIKCRLVKKEGRKIFVEAIAEGPEGVFASAEAVYVVVERKIMVNQGESKSKL